MKQFSKKLFSVALLLAVGTASAADVNGRSYFLGHVGGTVGNGLIGNAGRTHMHDMDALNGCFSLQTGYSQTFKDKELANYLFFNGTNEMIVRGTYNTAALPTDIMAQYLLISPALFASTVTAKPKISSSTTSVGLHLGLDEFMQGLHFNVNLPIVWTRWDMGLTATDSATASAALTAGVLSNAGAEAIQYTDVVSALKGDKTVGVYNEARKYAIVDGKQSHTKVGNVVATLGYDFISKENMHLSLGVHGLFNGGGASDAKYWFEPAVGTAGRHGVGGTVDGHVRLYEGDSDDVHFTGYVNAQVTHVLDGTVRRTYDATRHGVGSRLMLFKKDGTLNFDGATNAVTLANYTSLEAKIGMDVMYDANVMVRYQNGGLNCDLGYQAWGHSKEKHSKWVSGELPVNMGAISYNGANLADYLNANLTFSSSDVAINGRQKGNATTDATNNAGAAHAAANNLTLALLDKESALAPSAMSHTVFGNIGYGWDDSDWKPFVSVGGAGEFSGADNKAMNAWHVFVNGGVCF